MPTVTLTILSLPPQLPALSLAPNQFALKDGDNEVRVHNQVW